MTCNATTRDRGKLYICENDLNHESDHKDGTFTWARERPSGGPNERILEP